jgi:arylsulfatase
MISLLDEHVGENYKETEGIRQAVRLGKWKGIRARIQKDNMKIQLFNLDKDMQDQHNVAGQHPKVVQKIRHIMADQHTTQKVDL